MSDPGIQTTGTIRPAAAIPFQADTPELDYAAFPPGAMGYNPTLADWTCTSEIAGM